MKYYFLAIKNSFNYKGEATVKEFWSFFLINYLAVLPLLLFFQWYTGWDFPVYYFSYTSLLTLIPLGIRRLRNAGQPVWFFLFPFVNLMMAGMPDKNESEEE